MGAEDITTELTTNTVSATGAVDDQGHVDDVATSVANVIAPFA